MKKKEPRVYADTLLNQGGLMRCCIESLGEWVIEHKDNPAIVGTIVSCKYESDKTNENMILDVNYTWRWNRP